MFKKRRPRQRLPMLCPQWSSETSSSEALALGLPSDADFTAALENQRFIHPGAYVRGDRVVTPMRGVRGSYLQMCHLGDGACGTVLK